MNRKLKAQGMLALALTLILNFALFHTNAEAASKKQFKPNATVITTTKTYDPCSYVTREIKANTRVQIAKNFGFKVSMKHNKVKYYKCKFLDTNQMFGDVYSTTWIPASALSY